MGCAPSTMYEEFTKISKVSSVKRVRRLQKRLSSKAAMIPQYSPTKSPVTE